ncbi:hypothetical protein O53_4499 [Microcystis aeruginosa TAIHU98]|uniref:Uncharacterized protein n=1 Tax=Microcystis aeruginosa TAIHU98 TaxID=1134457 RepID=L7E3A2_MICAE|nr:hypothetical protein O53_4499 [Microcystis aeruginosa TAIHU98]ELS45644.1 hypothetical protein C789_4565 [Microcystis aeruginosa FACHB-905 = DIANCHI905]ODV38616.1 hypothetical protein BFG60_1960 [Microcystis aeruginosa NIES-98]
MKGSWLPQRRTLVFQSKNSPWQGVIMALTKFLSLVSRLRKCQIC